MLQLALAETFGDTSSERLEMKSRLRGWLYTCTRGNMGGWEAALSCAHGMRRADAEAACQIAPSRRARPIRSNCPAWHGGSAVS